jgi:RHS repeat-associated protein
LLTTASQITRSLFTVTDYETSAPARSDVQYVSDLYYAYLQRGPDTSGLNFWALQFLPHTTRADVCNMFEGSEEFQALVATLYGTASSDNERTDHFINNFYLGAFGRNATATELQQQRDALNAAAAQGQAQVQAQAETMGRSLFASQINERLSDTQFVTNLYESFLQRGPDAGGLSHWVTDASVGLGRQDVLNNFATCGAFRDLAATLHRDVNWLVADHLGTPRMVVNKSGSLASVKRHDYLPFGEELYAGMGGRTPQQGYTGDSVRQKFTEKERDNETGLDYFLARYYSSAQGRFTSPDEFTGGPDELYTFADDASNNPTFYANLGNPQSLNKYQYAYNNPLRYVDPDGHDPLDPPQNPACPCKQGPTDRQIIDALKAAADKAAQVTGIAALADWLQANGPAVGMAILDNGGASAMPQDMEDLRIMRNGVKSGNSQQGQQSQQGQSNTASPNPNNPNKKPIFGERGTQTTSTTVGNGKGWRVDVENPNPGQRPGQIHYQSGNTKLLYDPNTNSFVGASKTLNRQLMNNAQVQKAIQKGMKILGESQ